MARSLVCGQEAGIGKREAVPLQRGPYRKQAKLLAKKPQGTQYKQVAVKLSYLWYQGFHKVAGFVKASE